MTLSEIRSRLARAALKGVVSLSDPTILRTHRPSNGFAEDAKALHGDWKAVGDNLRTALKRASQGEQSRP